MRYCVFQSGSYKDHVSCIGLGTIGAGSRATASQTSIKNRLRSLYLAFDLGATYFDVGESYEEGFSEEIVGRFAKGRRDRVFIGTKFSPENSRAGDIARSLEGSLRRLRTDYVDLYQMHWPNPAVPFDETIEALERLALQGKIRHIGLGNCGIRAIRAANQLLQSQRIVSNQVKLNLCSRPTIIDPDYFTDTSASSITTMAYGILGQGRLRVALSRSSLIQRLCQKYEVTVPPLLIAWALRFPNTMALIRSMSPEHLTANIAASSLELDKRDWNLLNETFEPKVQEIRVNMIKVVNEDPDVSHKIYMTLADALANPHGLCPDVHMIANDIRRGEPFTPIEVVRRGGGYELVQGRMRYWAWRYVFGDEGLIPSLVIEECMA